MKKLLIAFALVFVASASGQGVAAFSNRTSHGDWKVALPNGDGAGTAVPPLAVDLFLADSSGATPVGTPLASTVFRTAPAAATFFVASIDYFIVPNAPPFSSAAKLVAVISGNGIRTELVPLIIDPVGLGLQHGPPGNLPAELYPANSALLGSTLMLQVPEPSTMALGITGAALLLLVPFREGNKNEHKPITKERFHWKRAGKLSHGNVIAR